VRFQEAKGKTAHSLEKRSEVNRPQLLIAVVAALGVALLSAPEAHAQTDADPRATPTPHSRSLVFPDGLGNPVEIAPEAMPGPLAPRPEQQQVPAVRRGTKASAERAERLRGGERTGVAWFSSAQPGLAPYLSGLDEYGNTAVQPGALFPDAPLSHAVQPLKYTLADYGFRYVLAQALEYATLTHVAPQAHDLGYYAYDFFMKQSVFHVQDTGTAGWISSELYGGAAFGAASRRTTPATALGALTDPADSVSGFNGIAVAELAWQQAFAGRSVVALAGVLDHESYLDTNAYANFSFGQFQNSAFVNSHVLPLTTGNFGLNLQWQPHPDFYAILGVGPNNAPPGSPPWKRLSGSDMSYLLEAAFVPSDLGGLGPGAYRLQPFVATVSGVTQAGVGFNLNQQLGRQSPLGVFARLGVGGETVTNIGGARAQIATGLVLQTPLHRLRLYLREASADIAGLGFVWSQPSANQRPAAHDNEYGVEALYIFQITPTAYITPDVQIIWDPVNNADLGNSVIFQLPLVTSW
jgi:porin